MTVRFTRRASQELGAQLAYLAAANTPAAGRLSAEVTHALEVLDADVADGGPVVLKSGRVVRRWHVPPLTFFYVRAGDVVTIVRVRHWAQRPLLRRS